MKIGKKILSILFVFILFVMADFVSAESAETRSHSFVYKGSSECNGGTFEKVIYAGTDNHEIVDTFTEKNQSYVWEFITPYPGVDDYSYVSVYNAFSKALTHPSIGYYSQGKPHNVDTVVVMGTKDVSVSSNIPSRYKRSTVAAQYAFYVRRWGFLYENGTDNEIEYVEPGKTNAFYKFSFDPFVDVVNYGDTECLNIHIGFCGDGILDNSSATYSSDINAPLKGGEECDPGDTTNKKGWGEMGCSASCKKLEASCGDGVKSPSEKCDYKDTTNKEGWGEMGCSTSCEPLPAVCGDGVKSPSEQCDYKDTTNKEGWGDGGCSDDCKAIGLPVSCGTLDKSKQYNANYPTPRITKDSAGLCGEGSSYKTNSISGPTNGNYEWKCKKGTEEKQCKASDMWCGDGSRNGTEECDPKDTTNKEGWGEMGCSASCKKLEASCGDGVKSPSEKCDYKDTTNKEGWGEMGCSTSCEPLPAVCGDGVKSPSEQCDYKDTTNKEGWGDDGCNNDCTIKTKGVSCGVLSGSKEYNANYPTPRITKDSTGLCGEGSSYKTNSISGPTNGNYEWKCKKGSEEKKCKASDIWCGDGSRNGTEECDPKDTNEKGWGEMGCSTSCKSLPAVCGDGVKSPSEQCDYKDTTYKEGWGDDGCNNDCTPKSKGVSCGALSGSSEYNANYPTPRITKDSTGLCGEGSSYKTNSISGPTNGNYEWKCKKGTEEKQCKASDMWCGDGSKNGTEQCDPKDTKNKEGWGNEGCSASCAADSVVKIDGKELLSDSTTYKIGDKIGFKVSFSNPTSFTIYDVVIKDIFPIQLDYDSAKVVGVGKVNVGTYSSGDGLVVEFSGFSMEAKQSGYLYITGTVTQLTDNGINWACSYKKDGTTDKSLCKDAKFKFKKDLKISKKASKTSVSVGETVDYSIIIENNGGEYSGLKIIDTLSGGLSYDGLASVVKGNAEILDQKTDGNMLIINLKVWDYGYGDSIELKYSVKVDEVRETYGNLVCAYDKSGLKINCGKEEIKKQEAELFINKRIGKVNDFDEKYWYKTQVFDTTGAYFRIDVENKNGALNDFIITDTFDTNQLSLALNDEDSINDQIKKSGDGKYAYVSTRDFKSNGNYEIKVVVTKGVFEKGDVYSVILPATLLASEGENVAKLSNGQKSSATFGSVPPPNYCGDGSQGGFEYCDLGPGGGIVNSAGKLFSNGDVSDSQYADWSCTDQCTLKSGSIIPSCFNVQNGSISIMTGELLPFYWNIEGLLGKNRSSTERQQYLRDNFFSKGSDSDCKIDNIYKIDLNSLLCDFIVYGPSNDGAQNIIYRLDNIPCIGRNGWGNGSSFPKIHGGGTSSYYPAIQHYIEQNWSGWFGGSTSVSDSKGGTYDIKNVFETMDDTRNAGYPTLFPYSSKLIITNFGAPSSLVLGAGIPVSPSSSLNYFGEYKISLDNISYDYCDYTIDGDKIVYKMTSKETNDRVCEVDFAVTNHYLVQKSPYGYVDTMTKNNLESYYLKNGNPLFVSVGGDTKEANYQIYSGVTDDFDTFISKYARIAKGDGSLKQVSGKLIFVTDLGKGERFNLSHSIPADVLSNNKPFTLIASNGADIVIEGNVVKNMMIITQGKIIFDAAGACNAQDFGSTKYSKAGQLVQGIFYAGDGFFSENDKLNNNVMNDYWCNYGNLHIKGVVLGKLDNVKNKRRSELYTWFNKHDVSKREVVLNGASVMIEFNSNLLSSDIPGVDEFNKLLVTQRE